MLTECTADVCFCVIGLRRRHWCPDVCSLQNHPQCQQCSICGINSIPNHIHTYTHYCVFKPPGAADINTPYVCRVCVCIMWMCLYVLLLLIPFCFGKFLEHFARSIVAGPQIYKFHHLLNRHSSHEHLLHAHTRHKEVQLKLIKYRWAVWRAHEAHCLCLNSMWVMSQPVNWAELNEPD